jgi:hypothetical protein
VNTHHLIYEFLNHLPERRATARSSIAHKHPRQICSCTKDI